MNKHILLAIIAFLFCNVAVTAQEESNEWDYDGTISLGVSINFPFIKNTSYNKDIYPAFNLSGVYGLFVHKKPLFNTLKLAVDLGFSADYGQLKEDKFSNALPDNNTGYPGVEDKNIKFTQVNLGLRFGPSIVYKVPRKYFYINLYAHFIPSVSSIIANNEFSFSYIPYHGFGIRFVDETMGIGVEYIQGKGKFKNIAAEEYNKMYKNNPHMKILEQKYIMQTMMFRVYISMVL